MSGLNESFEQKPSPNLPLASGKGAHRKRKAAAKPQKGKKVKKNLDADEDDDCILVEIVESNVAERNSNLERNVLPSVKLKDQESMTELNVVTKCTQTRPLMTNPSQQQLQPPGLAFYVLTMSVLIARVGAVILLR